MTEDTKNKIVGTALLLAIVFLMASSMVAAERDSFVPDGLLEKMEARPQDF